jgi:transposase
LVPELEAARTEYGAEMVLMQDNAPCHKAAIVTEFLRQNQVSTLPWPPQSPDLNPIENLWAIIKARHQRDFPIPKNKNELIDQIFDIWDNLESELAESLANSFVSRLLKCLERDGKHTGY